MSRDPLSSASRAGPFDKLAGVAAQFEPAGDGYLYRQDGWGPGIPVTLLERDAFVRAGARDLLLHLAALALCVVAAWLAAVRVTSGADDVVGAVVFATFASAAAILLLISHEWHRRAASRAMAARRPAAPPRTAPGGGAGYGTIAGVMAIALLWLFTGTIGTTAYRAFFAVSVLLIGMFLIVRRWLARRRLTPSQRRAATPLRRASAEPASVGAGCAMLLFFLLETVAGIFALFGTVALVLRLAGQPIEDPNGWVFAIGFLLGGAVAYAAMRMIDRLCKRWTGLSAMDAFSWLPVHW
ncbi:hypothetical protein [Sphingomonas mucosissima]|uniref:Uncharacterized protein n=1 Tax=Sphingomonas mucosissima TaxID=370959 RepID=A0A245ZT19_9SPHN|nr:hypothetical protein [Sphingomonas mucosissima]OWK32867.1 hypothetical protein SPMU_12090 [Sphingomonas mucosissima]